MKQKPRQHSKITRTVEKTQEIQAPLENALKIARASKAVQDFQKALLKLKGLLDRFDTKIEYTETILKPQKPLKK